MQQNNVISFDEIISKIGEVGKFQQRNILILTIILIFSTMPLPAYIFTAGQMNYRCRIPECDKLINGTIEYSPTWLFNAMPFDDLDNPVKCMKYEFVQNNNSANENEQICSSESFDESNLIECNDFIYQSIDELTILKEFNLTCRENEWRLTIMGSLGYLTDIISLPLWASLSDRCGRKPILIFTVTFASIIGLIDSYSINYTMFFIMELLADFLASGATMIIFVIGIESSSTQTRCMIATYIAFVNSFSSVLTGLVAWYYQNFRHLLRALYIPNLLLITIIWLLPESVRWLLKNGKLDKAKEIILIAAAMNHVELNGITDKMVNKVTEINQQQQQQQQQQQSQTPENIQIQNQNSGGLFAHLRRSNILLFRWICILMSWFCIHLIESGLNRYSVILAGNKYLNYFIVHLISLPAIIFAYFLINSCGRKTVVVACMIFCGINCLASQFGNSKSQLIMLTFYTLAKFTACMAYSIMRILTIELFPTLVRLRFVNSGRQSAALAAIFAPQVPLLNSIWHPLPLILFSGLSFFSSLFIVVLPETLNTKLPDTIEQAENIGKK